jgi:Sec-independent protein translocase protein TatA
MTPILLALILIVLVAIFVVLAKQKPAPIIQTDNKPMEEMASIMREAHEEAERAVRDKELVEYANRKLKNAPTPVLSSDQGDRQVGSGRDLIPYGLTEEEKRILEEFNR